MARKWWILSSALIVAGCFAYVRAQEAPEGVEGNREPRSLALGADDGSTRSVLRKSSRSGDTRTAVDNTKSSTDDSGTSTSRTSSSSSGSNSSRNTGVSNASARESTSTEAPSVLKRKPRSTTQKQSATAEEPAERVSQLPTTTQPAAPAATSKQSAEESPRSTTIETPAASRFRGNTATKEVTKETSREAAKEVAPPAARETDADAPADDAGQRGQQETASSTNDELRISSESPRVAVQMVGPEAITIGKAAKYTVVIVNDVLAAKQNEGYDAEHDRMGDMFKLGIIDPVKVTRVALENAVSVSALMLTTEAAVGEIPGPKTPPMGGMGGMGGGEMDF